MLGKRFLFASGDNISDFRKYSDLNREKIGRLEMLTRQVFHTCPNSLPMFPFQNKAPMVLVEGLPDFYVVGDASKFCEDVLASQQKNGRMKIQCEGQDQANGNIIIN